MLPTTKQFLPLFTFLLLAFYCCSQSLEQSAAAKTALVNLSQRLNRLKTLRLEQTRELNYASENYHNSSKWQVYYDFQPADTLTGCYYQIADPAQQQFYNGSEQFALDLATKKYSLDVYPNKQSLGSLSALYNSIVTFKNILPVLIRDAAISGSVADTILDNESCMAIRLQLGKRRIQNLGRGLDAMTTTSNFIYTIFVDKRTGLPRAVVQSNDGNSDSIKTGFTGIDIQPLSPADSSWYYSSYLPGYTRAGATSDPVLVSRGSRAPLWALPQYNMDSIVSLAGLKGKVIVLDFWIKNCGPCILSVPHLNALQKKYGSKNVQVISINAYDPAAAVQWFCEKHGVQYPVLLQGGAVAVQYGVSGFPTLFVIDAQGKIAFGAVGYDERIQGELEKAIEAAR